MKANIKFVSTKGWTDQEWHRYRLQGVGSSECASALGRDRYKPKLRLHLEKTKQWDPTFEDSFQTYRGRCIEQSIMRDYWRFYTTDKESVLLNMINSDYVPKKYGKVRGFYHNDKYDWLYSTPDAKAPKGLPKLTDGTINETETLIEAKSIASYYAKSFIIGFPEAYLIQTQSQLVVTELEYVELMLLEDGTIPALYGFDYEPNLCEIIIEGTKEFMDNARETIKYIKIKEEALIHGRTDELADIEYEITKREPGPEDSDSYAEFLTERYKERQMENVMIGNDGQYRLALKLLEIKETLKPIEAEKKLIENTFKEQMGKAEANSINFDEGRGSISWRKDVNGTFRFRNDVRIIE
jgi:predicted phage-related endonuclease